MQRGPRLTSTVLLEKRQIINSSSRQKQHTDTEGESGANLPTSTRAFFHQKPQKKNTREGHVNQYLVKNFMGILLPSRNKEHSYRQRYQSASVSRTPAVSAVITTNKYRSNNIPSPATQEILHFVIEGQNKNTRDSAA